MILLWYINILWKMRREFADPIGNRSLAWDNQVKSFSRLAQDEPTSSCTHPAPRHWLCELARRSPGSLWCKVGRTQGDSPIQKTGYFKRCDHCLLFLCNTTGRPRPIRTHSPVRLHITLMTAGSLGLVWFGLSTPDSERPLRNLIKPDAERPTACINCPEAFNPRLKCL